MSDMSSWSHIWRFLILGVVCLVPLPSIAWEEIDADIGLEINRNASLTPPETERTIKYSAARLHQHGLQLDLVTLNELLSEEYENLGPDNVVLLEDGMERVSIRPTVGTAWDLLNEDPNVVGVVPIGFSEVAGSTDVAGFIRSTTLKQESIFSAPNLDTLLCLNDVEYVSKNVNKDELVDFDYPSLFRIKQSQPYSYRYLDDLETIDFVGKSGDLESRFESCEKMIQTGFRVIDSFPMLTLNSQTNRLSYDEMSHKRSYYLNVMVFDVKERFSFVHFLSEVSPYEAGLAISSDAFFGEDCSNPVELGRSCEIWAVTVSAFDQAGMVFRTSQEESERWIGERDVISPAVLVLRQRESKDKQD